MVPDRGPKSPCPSRETSSCVVAFGVKDIWYVWVKAAAQVAAESLRSRIATDAAFDARLQELARSRG